MPARFWVCQVAAFSYIEVSSFARFYSVGVKMFLGKRTPEKTLTPLGVKQ